MNDSPTPPSEEPSVSPSATPEPTPDVSPIVGISANMRNGIALVITVVWAGSFVADVVLGDFETSPFIYMTMLGLAAAVFGSGFVKGIK